MDALSDAAALLGLTDADDKRDVVDRLAQERGLPPADDRIRQMVTENKARCHACERCASERSARHCAARPAAAAAASVAAH